MSLSQNIKRLRVSKSLSQEKLARLADVTHVNLSKLERGEKDNPTMKTLIKLANALEVTIDELVGREFKKPKN